ncbi:MAG: SGNH/GDSL hydrolase family protein [Verrucomicrobia bacterium]|nr:SGNH/GDSL hydrolase family protein [Verrucomicrobiota bacterium]
MNSLDDALLYTAFALAPLVIAYALVAFHRYRRGTGKQRSIYQVLVGNTLVFLLLAAVLLFGFETYLRFFADFTDSYAMSRMTVRWHDKHAHYNSIGSRDNIEYDLKQAPGKRRITFLGDSFTAGHGIADVEERFVNLVRKKRPDWEVQTISRNSQDTGDEIKRVRVAGEIGYDLDVVVLVYCMNDISDLMPEWKAAWERMDRKFRKTGYLTTHSMLFNTLHYRLLGMRDSDVRNYFPSVKEAYEDERWDQQKERLKELRDEVRARNATLLVVTFPFLHAMGSEYAFGDIHAKLDGTWKSLGVPHLDLLPLYRNLSRRELTVNMFDAHPSILAHRMAAEAMETFIEDHLEPAAPPPRGGSVP